MFTLLYTGLAGWQIPVQRAGWMAALAFAAILFERSYHSANSLFFAAFVILAAEPKNLFNISFQLSFLSVLALSLFLRILSKPHPWQEMLVNTLSVHVGTFPVVIYYFNMFSAVSLLANLIAIPLFNFALLVGFIFLLAAKIPGVGFLVKSVLQGMFAVGMNWIEFCSKIPWGSVAVETPGPFQMAAYYLIVGLLLLERHLSAKKYSILEFVTGIVKRKPAFFLVRIFRGVLLGFWLVSALSFFMLRQKDVFSATFLSMGKNDATHLTFKGGRHWLINTGQGAPSDQTHWILAPYFRSRGITTLDGILLTDQRKKHAGGVPALTENFTVRHLAFPGFRKDASFKDGFHADIKFKKYLKKAVLKADDRMIFSEDEEIRVLDDTDSKVTLWVRAGDFKMLILPELNRDLAEKIGMLGESSCGATAVVLPPPAAYSAKVAEELLIKIRPRAVIVPAGSAALEKMLERNHIRLFDLERLGALQLRRDDQNKSWIPRSYRFGNLKNL